MEYKHKVVEMISKEQIDEAVAKLGKKLTQDYKSEPVVMVGETGWWWMSLKRETGFLLLCMEYFLKRLPIRGMGAYMLKW